MCIHDCIRNCVSSCLASFRDPICSPLCINFGRAGRGEYVVNSKGVDVVRTKTEDKDIAAKVIDDHLEATTMLNHIKAGVVTHVSGDLMYKPQISPRSSYRGISNQPRPSCDVVYATVNKHRKPEEPFAIGNVYETIGDVDLECDRVVSCFNDMLDGFGSVETLPNPDGRSLTSENHFKNNEIRISATDVEGDSSHDSTWGSDFSNS